MPVDLTVPLIHATVEIDQPVAGGVRTVGTAFLIQAPRPDGTPRVVLVTADHVLRGMPGKMMRVGWRYRQSGGAWSFQPAEIPLRDADSKPLWTRHPKWDVAAMEITAPESFVRAAMPLGWLTDETSFERMGVAPGDEMLALGYPEGFAANGSGFPILRVGRVASYPLTPTREFPTFLLDFRVFRGNSGGPVFTTPALRRGVADTTQPLEPRIMGILVQQTAIGDERLELGIIVNGAYVRETIALLDQPRPPATPAITPAQE